MATQAHSTAIFTDDKPKNSRPVANFPPTIWGSSFASFSFPQAEFETYNRQVEVLKQEVRDMSVASTKDPMENIEFINLLCRLGVSYHFDNEIEDQLKHIFQVLPNLLEDNDLDLYKASLLFRVLRQHGYKMSSVVFYKFKDSDGKWEKSIINDVKGILSLYEATFLSMHGEDILEEALAFTREILKKSLAMESSQHLADHIENALLRPFHKGVPRIEAKKYISFYQEDDSLNHTLLKFAQLDFNRLQLLHQQELSILSRWWKDLKFAEEFPYARDRVVEIYFWANGIHFEPQYASTRISVTKYTKLISLLDDTYDAYATFDELQHFTNAIEWFDGLSPIYNSLISLCNFLRASRLQLHPKRQMEGHFEKIYKNYGGIIGDNFHKYIGSFSHLAPKVAKELLFLPILMLMQRNFSSVFGLCCSISVRCNSDAIDQLPTDNLKGLYKAFLNLFNETENDVGKKGRSYATYYVKEAFKELARSYHAEAQWAHNGHVPTFDEYVRNGLGTSAYGLIMAASFAGMEVAGMDEFEWLRSNPKIIKAGRMIGRLMNDIVGHEDEQKRGDCASGVQCYMKGYDVLENVAIEENRMICENAWKDMNNGFMSQRNVPKLLLQHFVNLIRVTDVIYGREDDAYTIPASLKDYVISLYVEKIPMSE